MVKYKFLIKFANDLVIIAPVMASPTVMAAIVRNVFVLIVVMIECNDQYAGVSVQVSFSFSGSSGSELDIVSIRPS